MSVSFDLNRLKQIAAECGADSTALQDQATRMKRHVNDLREALQGIPNVAQAERFENWNQLFAKMSTELDESNRYLKSIVTKVEQFITDVSR